MFKLKGESCGKKNQDLALIKKLNGAVFKKESIKGEWARVQVGDKLPLKTAIKASGNSECDLQLSDNVSIRMKERTILYLKDLYNDKKKNKQKTKLAIAKGSVLLKVSKLMKNGSSISLETPTTVAGVTAAVASV